jgi:hypothetical protein
MMVVKQEIMHNYDTKVAPQISKAGKYLEEELKKIKVESTNLEKVKVYTLI